MQRFAMFLSAICIFAATGGWAATAPCPPSAYDASKLLALRQAHFVVEDSSERTALAKGLLACLASRDAKLRDTIAYEAYATWRHDKALDAATWTFIEGALVLELDADRPDPEGVLKPFAALVLAEVVKAHRATPFLKTEDLQTLLQAATGYLTTLRDYRGFDSDVGWRHGVAHSADLLAQLSLLPAFGRAELDRILAAIANQVVAGNAHFYVYGESERLAEAVSTIATRDVYSTQEWESWLTKITGPNPFRNWGEAYSSQAGLAKRHDTMNFLLALYADARDDKHAPLARIAPLVAKAMQPLR